MSRTQVFGVFTIGSGLGALVAPYTPGGPLVWGAMMIVTGVVVCAIEYGIKNSLPPDIF